MQGKLNQLTPGKRGVVLSVDESAKQDMRGLASRGIVPGAAVTMLRQGNPVIFAVDHSRWALDTDAAGDVSVQFDG